MLPSAVPDFMCARSRSPALRCTSLNSSTSFAHCAARCHISTWSCISWLITMHKNLSAPCLQHITGSPLHASMTNDEQHAGAESSLNPERYFACSDPSNHTRSLQMPGQPQLHADMRVFCSRCRYDYSQCLWLRTLLGQSDVAMADLCSFARAWPPQDKDDCPL